MAYQRRDKQEATAVLVRRLEVRLAAVGAKAPGNHRDGAHKAQVRILPVLQEVLLL